MSEPKWTTWVVIEPAAFYEALSGAVEWYEAISQPPAIEPEWVGLARAALAKARGEQA